MGYYKSETITLYSTVATDSTTGVWNNVSEVADQNTNTYAYYTTTIDGGVESNNWISGNKFTFDSDIEYYFDSRFTPKSEILDVKIGFICNYNTGGVLPNVSRVFRTVAITIDGEETVIPGSVYTQIDGDKETYLYNLPDTTAEITYDLIRENINIKAYFENKTLFGSGYPCQVRIYEFVMEIRVRNFIDDDSVVGNYIENEQYPRIQDTTSGVWYNLDCSIDSTSVCSTNIDHKFKYYDFFFDGTSYSYALLENDSTSSYYLEFTTHDLTDEVPFNRIWFGIELQPSYYNYNSAFYVQTVFDGTNIGDIYIPEYEDLAFGIQWFEITNDSAAPAVWTWNDITNLNIRMYGEITDPLDYSSELEVYIDGVYLRVFDQTDSTSVYGLEVYNGDAEKILAYDNRITRLLYTTIVSSGSNGNTYIKGAALGLQSDDDIFGYSYALESGKIPHNVSTSIVGSDIYVSWSPKSLTIQYSTGVQSSDSQIVIFAY